MSESFELGGRDRRHSHLVRAFVGTVVTVAYLASAGCSGSDSSDGATRPRGEPSVLPRLGKQRQVALEDVELVASVSTATSCDDLLAKLRTVADEHVGPYGFGYGGMYSAEADGLARTGDMATSKSAVPAAQAGGNGSSGEFSGTNNQVVGVDEADIIKTDGKLLVVLRDRRVVIVDATPAGRARGSVELDKNTSPSQLLMSGSTVLVIGQSYQNERVAKGALTDDLLRAPMSRTSITMVDISDPDAPKISDSVVVDGSVQGARMVGDEARLVLTSMPMGLPFVQPQSVLAEETALDMNRRIAATAPLEQWLPHLWRNGKRNDLVPCDRVTLPDTFAGVALTSIVSLPMAPRVAAEATSLLAPGDVVYASPSNVYITSQAWVDPKLTEEPSKLPEQIDWKTAVHRFTFEDGGPARYVASGTVPGTVRNSFSIGEVGADGERIGIATTSGSPWSATEESTSQLIVLKTEGTNLVRTGSVDGLGKGEAIQSVRFVGKRAYVVTFRQTDPFFVVDLAEPDRPRLAGELQLLGYSGYLHPISETLILGIGRDADAKGVDTGMRATLFDVSNAAAPTAVGAWTDPHGYSDVEWDHHGFLYWGPAKLAMFPSTSYGKQGEPGVAAMVGLSVGDSPSQKGTLSERGRVIHRTGPVGETECKKATAADVEKMTGQPAKYLVSGSNFVQLCAPGQKRGASEMSCYEIDDDQIISSTGKKRDELGLPSDTVVEMCSVNGVQPLERSVVVGSTVWTLGGSVLQANDLATLKAGARIRL